MDSTDKLLSMAESLIDKGGSALRRFREEVLIDLDGRLKVISEVHAAHELQGCLVGRCIRIQDPVHFSEPVREPGAGRE